LRDDAWLSGANPTLACAGPAIVALFRVNRYVGNLPPMPGVFPDYSAPVVRNLGADRALTLMRWGTPPLVLS
jgi:putative SOS response-associated peptidase YedK